MNALRVALSAAAQACWLAVSGLGRALLGAGRFDRLVGATGVRGLKERWFLDAQTMPDGNRLYLRPSDRTIVDEVYGHGVYNGAALAPGAVVVDVGGHIGTFALMAGRAVGPKGRVIVFEPSPDTLGMLRRNLDANPMPWVTLRAVALAEKAGEAVLYTAVPGEDNPAADTLFPAEGRRPVTVPVLTLDEALAAEGVKDVDLLKVDVEGAELRVLAGGAKTLAAARRVLMEVHTLHVKREAALAALEKAGLKTRVLSEAEHGLIVEGRRA